ncbi:Cyclic nucleotide-gated cation channel alpha-3 [Coelomomyces lativittatus]|nr:Cyclic nucleotide-gated cation channel alpha-3 [Coelomomyces lativittatus]
MAAPSPKSDEVVFVLDHESRIRFAWDMVQCVAVLLLLAYLPYRIGFQLLDWRPWIGPDIVHDLLIYTDIILNLCTSIEVEGEYISERRVIMTEYAKTWLIPDILSVIPLDLCTLSLGYYQPAFRSNRLIRLTRIYYYFGEIEKRAPIKPTAVKLVKAAIALIVACHMLQQRTAQDEPRDVFHVLRHHFRDSILGYCDWCGR